MAESSLNWPDGVPRTPADDRTTSNFQVGFQRTKRELREELEKMGVGGWWLDHVTGSHGDPGVVLRWKDDGGEYAVWCDGYKHKKDNLREVYKWVSETRMREKRLAETAQDAFAAAALPSGDEPAGNGTGYDLNVAPHALLGVPEDADDETVRKAARQLIIEYHPDQNDDEDSQEYVKRIKAAKEAMERGK